MSSNESGERLFEKQKKLNYDKEISDKTTAAILTSVMFFVPNGSNNNTRCL